jgi:hypothetical protein
MKKTLLLLLLASGLTAYATDPPKFLVGLNYVLKSDLTDKGVPYQYYEVTRDYKELKKRVLKYKKKSVSVDRNGLLFVDRRVGDYVVTTVSGFGLRKAYVYQE